MALFVVVRDEMFFKDPKEVAVRRFLWRVTWSWFVVLMASAIMTIPLRFFIALLPLDRESLTTRFMVNAGWYFAFGVIQASLASFFLASLPVISNRHPDGSLPSVVRRSRRPLLISCLILYVFVSLIDFGFFVSFYIPRITESRIDAVAAAVEAFWTVLLAFAFYERTQTSRDPAVVSVFD
jgi:hypothetical protein